MLIKIKPRQYKFSTDFSPYEIRNESYLEKRRLWYFLPPHPHIRVTVYVFSLSLSPPGVSYLLLSGTISFSISRPEAAPVPI